MILTHQPEWADAAFSAQLFDGRYTLGDEALKAALAAGQQLASIVTGTHEVTQSATATARAVQWAAENPVLILGSALAVGGVAAATTFFLLTQCRRR